MELIAYWLPLVWAALLGVAVVMYVLLDGFDLGIGILFLTAAEEQDRDTMMNSIAPYWDGNETWLVLGGAGLLVAFPLAYAIIMPALYLPILIMLLALVFRGVAFEFRFVSKPRHRFWDWSFALGSTVATFCQGLVLGGFIQGINVSGGQFAGGSFEWLAPFPILCGFGLIAGYALLGSTWLMMKTEGEVAQRAKRHASCIRSHRGAVVSRRAARLSLARAFSHGHCRVHRLDRAQQKLGRASVSFYDGAFSPLFSWASDLDLPLSRTPERDHLAGGGCSPIANLQLGRGPLVFTTHSGLYSVCLLDLPRPGRRG